MLKRFPSIPHLGSKGTENIFEGNIIITEKIDGSQFAFGLVNNKLQFRAKNTEIDLDLIHGHDTFDLAVDTVLQLSNEKKLTPNLVYIGEYLRKPRHNGLKYEKIPLGHIALFAIYDMNSRSFLPRHQIEQESSHLNLGLPQVIFEGDGSQAKSELESLLKSKSALGGEIEGIIIFNSNNKQIAKYVREDFKEVTRAHVRKDKKDHHPLNLLKESYRTEARWQKAYQHLHDEGKLLKDAKDIGALCKEVQADILKECEEDIKQELFNIFKGDILRRAVGGLPEWYKSKLRNLVERDVE